ncbi:hypothetical protein ACT3SQ_01355 [Brachybacterium sp. AOP42-C2-15]|uniref:hypothetical protein n=1 Tax=Brachybacterium sp. AOP42-C2-15 TaxID=3457670 RepID=UPI004033E886
MTRFRSPLEPALSAAFARLREPRRINPTWLPHLDGAALQRPDLAPAEQRLAQRALIATVVIALTATTPEGREELRVVLDTAGAIALTRIGDDPYEWWDAPFEVIPDLVLTLLSSSSRLAAAPQMTTRGPHNALTLTAEQRRAIAARVADGIPAHEAIDAQTDLSAPLRDALLSDRERATFDICMHVPPTPHTPMLRFHLLRRWNVGAHGLYSADGEDGFSDALHQVAEGDVLATVLPLLEEGAGLAFGKEVVA